MWFPSLLTSSWKQLLNSRKEYIHAFNYHQGLTGFKMHLVLPEEPWPTPTLGVKGVRMGVGEKTCLFRRVAFAD